jgi:hypothetical protein
MHRSRLLLFCVINLIQNNFLVMKILLSAAVVFTCGLVSTGASAQSNNVTASVEKGENNLYIDVHRLPPGKVSYEDVAKAHAKDLAVQSKYGVEFLKYWVDESKGLVYCLSSARDSSSIRGAHKEAHGLLPAEIYAVTDGPEVAANGQKNFFLDIHKFGPGNVNAAAVAEAHKKDLATEKKYGVNFINYWVDEKKGVVMCLSEAPDSGAIIKTHKEAHGLIPVEIMKVKQGQ